MRSGLMSRLNKMIIAILLPGLVVACNSTLTGGKPTPVVPPEGWTLVWQNEFDGKKIDPKNWTYDLGGGGWGNGEAQYYTSRPENPRLNGNLIIEARQENSKARTYLCSGLKPRDCKSSSMAGSKPASGPCRSRALACVLMLGPDLNGSNWPDCGEIDIMEYVGKEPDLIMGTAHGPGYSGALGITQWNRQTNNIADDFHTYAIEWEPDQIRWYYDGVQCHTG